MPETQACPTCGKKVPVADGRKPEGFPFCSSRCRDRDFGRWIDGGYTIAGRTLSSENDPYADDADLDPR